MAPPDGATTGSSPGNQIGVVGDNAAPPGVNPDQTGSVGAQLTLPSGQQIQVVTWAITGPNGATTVIRSGSVNVLNTLTVRFLVSSIPAAAGYRLSISGSAKDGSVTCSGSAPFDIVARQTTEVSVALACTVATSGSQVTLVTGQSFNCAAVNSVSASPVEVNVGGSVSLSAMASAPIASALTYAWSAASGSLANPSSSTTSFTCTSAGLVAVTLTVADGPVPSGASCDTNLSTKTVTIMCDAVQVPPVAVPGMPPWAVAALAAAMMMLGSVASLRRARGLSTSPKIESQF